MALPITNNTRFAAGKIIKEPNLVLAIEGLDFTFGAGVVKTLIKIGEPGLFIDGSWLIGGARILPGQLTSLSLEGSSTTIRQQVEVDKARGSSIQSMQIELVDLGGFISKLISPGILIDDVLGKKATVYLAIDNSTAQWPDDYEILFKGNIDDIKPLPASVIFNISHPEQKKKQTIWPVGESTLVGSIDATQTSIIITDAASFLQTVTGPDMLTDPDFKTYVRIENEVIQYTAISGNTLTGCLRGQLGTQNISHLADKPVLSLYRLNGDAMALALKFMLSRQDNYLADIKMFSFNLVSGFGVIPNSIFFDGINAAKEYGIAVGDYISTAGSGNPGSNDVTLKRIIEYGNVPEGSYIVIDGVTFVDESDTAALVSFRSQYDVWPRTLGMGSDEVDVAQHEMIRQRYLSGFLYDMYIKDTIEDGREFLEQEFYKPASAYSLPRKAKASVTLMVPPLPDANTKLLDESSIVNASKIVPRRSTTKNFANTIVYRFDEDPIETDEKRIFTKGHIEQSATSLTQIKVGTKALVINSKGLRSSSLGSLLAEAAAQRRLRRYEFGAEYFEGVQTTFGAGFDIEVGDVIIFDGSKLNLVDTATGVRGRPASLMEVQNKSLNYKTGEVKLDLVNTNFNGAGKYALIGPASRIKAGVDNKTFIVEPYYRTIYGAAEYQKWSRYKLPAVRIRSEDGVTRFFETVLVNALTNTFVVRDDMGFTPQEGDIVEIAAHDFVDTTDEIKLRYGHMAPLNGGTVDPYQMFG